MVPLWEVGYCVSYFLRKMFFLAFLFQCGFNLEPEDKLSVPQAKVHPHPQRDMPSHPQLWSRALVSLHPSESGPRCLSRATPREGSRVE